MTLASSTSKVTYTGNGVTTSWPVTFRCLSASHVTLTRTAPDGTEAAIASGFTVTLGTDGTGSVTYPVSGDPLPSGHKLTIRRVVPLTQEVAMTNQGAFYARVHEDAFDLLTMQAQQTAEVAGRALALPVSESPAPQLPPAAQRSGKILVFDETGAPTVSRDDWVDQATAAASAADDAAASAALASALANTSIRVVSTLADLRALTAALAAERPTIYLAGYYAAGDGGGGYFLWDGASAVADDGGTVIALTGVTTGRARRIVVGPLDARWFGARADGTGNAASAINAALALGREVVLAKGDYRITQTIAPATGSALRGAGEGLTRIVVAGDGFSAVTVQSAAGVAVTDLTIVADRTAYPSTSNNGILAPASGTGAPDLRVERITVTDVNGAGVIVLGQAGARSDRPVIRNVTVRRTGAHGIIVQDGASYAVIDGCTVDSPGLAVADRPGITAGRGSTWSRISGCTVLMASGASGTKGNAAHGISVEGAHGYVSGCYIERPKGYGVEVNASWCTVVGVDVVDPGGLDSTGAAIGGAGVMVVSDTTTGALEQVHVVGCSARLRDLTTTLAYGVGVTMNGTSPPSHSGVTVTDCTATGAFQHGIFYQYADGGAVRGCVVRGTTKSGVWLTLCTNTTLSGNRTIGCNTAADPAHGGIRWAATSAQAGNVWCADNVATGSGVRDIYPTIDGALANFSTGQTVVNPLVPSRPGLVLGDATTPTSSFNATFNNVKAAGTTTLVPRAVQTLTAGAAIAVTSEVTPINASSPVTLTSAPTIADGSDGQTITLVNVNNNAITLQDQGTLAGSNLRLEAATLAIPPRGSVRLMFLAVYGDWVQIGKVTAPL